MMRYTTRQASWFAAMAFVLAACLSMCFAPMAFAADEGVGANGEGASAETQHAALEAQAAIQAQAATDAAAGESVESMQPIAGGADDEQPAVMQTAEEQNMSGSATNTGEDDKGNSAAGSEEAGSGSGKSTSGTNGNNNEGGSKDNDSGTEKGTEGGSGDDQPGSNSDDQTKDGGNQNTDGATKDDQTTDDQTKDDQTKDDQTKDDQTDSGKSQEDRAKEHQADNADKPDGRNDGTKTDEGKDGANGQDEASDAAEADHVVMFRLYNPNSGEHFYTADVLERNNLVPLGWTYEGLGWEAPVTGDAVYRVYNPYSGDHHYTTDAAERDMLVGVGWNDEGIGWHSDKSTGSPLYRLYNPNALAGSHHYTLHAAERDSLIGAGWIDEGIAWYGQIPDGSYEDDMEPGTGILRGLPEGVEANYTPVYRLYHPVVNDHLYTTNAGERNSAAEWIWHYEGASWMSPNVGTPVYRLSDPQTGRHMFTLAEGEIGELEGAGWQNEGLAFYSTSEGDANRIPVYRLSDPATGDHFFTPSESERSSLLGNGWADEGVAWYGRTMDASFQDDLEKWAPRISGDATFDMQLENILYYHGSLKEAYDYVVDSSYISGDRFWSGPFYLDDGLTKLYAQEMIADGGGNCYKFASLFSWLARGLGYSSNVCSGYVPSASGGSAPHGWVELYIDGETYVCDPDLEHELGGNWYMQTYGAANTSYGSW